MKRLICLFLAAAIFLGAGSFLFPEVNNNIELQRAYEFSASLGELVGEYAGEENAQNRLIVSASEIKDNCGAAVVIESCGLSVMQFDDYDSSQAALEKLQTDGVKCERDSIITLDYSDDTDVSQVSDEVYETYAVSSASLVSYYEDGDYDCDDITIGVIDTGIDSDHELLSGRIIEFDKNFSSSGYQNSSEDDSGHGTGVAGVIVKNTPSNVKIKPYKLFNSDGSATNSQITALMRYIYAESDKPDILNMSFGISSVTSSYVRDNLTEKIIDSGVTVVASAGNKNANAKYYYPANIEGAITVSASDRQNKKANFSNYGSIVDVAAPGVDIYTSTIGGKYEYQSGTSFSAPMVSAAAAAVLMKNKELSCSEVENKIKEAAVDVYDKKAGCDWCGAGIINFTNLFGETDVSAPVFSVQAGEYSVPVELELTADGSDEIIYTTDCSTPSKTNGEVYSSPITISDDTHIIAVAYSDTSRSKYSGSTYEIVYNAEEEDFEISDDGILKAYNGDKTNITVPETVNEITVKEIGGGVFKSSDITGITLPDTVEKIGDGAFASSKLVSITGEGVKEIGVGAFENCEKLVYVNMKGVEAVGASAFYSCSLLTKVYFGDTLKTLGKNAFSFSALSSADFPNITSADSAFIGSKLIEASLPLVGTLNKTFCYCSLLSCVNADNVTEIKNNAFNDCTALLSFDLSNVKTVGINGLRKCSISRIVLSECTYIGESAFYGSSSTYISIPKITTVRAGAFSSCTELKELDMPEVTCFDDISKEFFTDCRSLNGLWLPKAENLPAITWSSSCILSMKYGIKAQLKYIFAPNVRAVYSSEDIPFTDYCTKLEYVFLPRVSEIDFLSCSNDCVWYIGAAESLPDMESGDFKVVANKDSYAAKWAEKCGAELIVSEKCSFSENDGDELEYIYADENEKLSLPSDALKYLWQTDLIGKKTSENSIAFLVDFTNDKTVNAKDFSLLQKMKR